MIIGVPSAWRVTPSIDGAVIDTPAGRVVHVARAPLVRARELIAQRLAWRPGFALASLDRATTDEGELAVLACARDDHRVIAWGIVFADESLAYYELECAIDHESSARETVAIAMRAHRFGLGRRWRRFRYAVPAGWDAIARGLVTDWYAPGFPRSWAVLTAYPALPAQGTAIGIVPSLVANAKAQGLVIHSEQPLTPESAHGLEGVGVVVAGTFGGTAVKVQIAAFLDDRYVYTMELQSRSVDAWTDHQAALVEVVRSIEPLPRQRAGIEEG